MITEGQTELTSATSSFIKPKSGCITFHVCLLYTVCLQYAITKYWQKTVCPTNPTV